MWSVGEHEQDLGFVAYVASRAAKRGTRFSKSRFMRRTAMGIVINY